MNTKEVFVTGHSIMYLEQIATIFFCSEFPSNVPQVPKNFQKNLCCRSCIPAFSVWHIRWCVYQAYSDA